MYETRVRLLQLMRVIVRPVGLTEPLINSGPKHVLVFESFSFLHPVCFHLTLLYLAIYTHVHSALALQKLFNYTTGV